MGIWVSLLQKIFTEVRNDFGFLKFEMLQTEWFEKVDHRILTMVEENFEFQSLKLITYYITMKENFDFNCLKFSKMKDLSKIIAEYFVHG